MKFLTNDQLNKLSTERLLKILHVVRAKESAIFHYYGPRCCEWCNDYIGNDWENDVAVHARPFTEYKNRIKLILKLHKNIKGQCKYNGIVYTQTRPRDRRYNK